MLSEDSLQGIARDYGVWAIWADETASTNADALALAEAGAPEHSIVVAGHQTAGRGRLGRAWTTTPGSSLLLSVVLRPPIESAEAPLVALHAALCMLEACRTFLGVAGLKWPNDLVVGDRKLAGVLPEAKIVAGRLEHVVVGIGLNLRQRPDDFPPDIRPRATSLALEGASLDDREELILLRAFMAELIEHPAGSAGWQERVLRSARRDCVSLGREVRATTVDGREVVGKAVNLDEHGGLVIKAGGRRETIAFGEVHHLR
jgi:BirA family biotin operon repressor/biotin-[acetyl-CoA-carboxylase] ligase